MDVVSHITPATGAQRQLRPATEGSDLIALVMGHTSEALG